MSVGSKAELSLQRKAADLKNNKECEAAKQTATSVTTMVTCTCSSYLL